MGRTGIGVEGAIVWVDGMDATGGAAESKKETGGVYEGEVICRLLDEPMCRFAEMPGQCSMNLKLRF